MQISDGRYTVVYVGGAYRTLRFRAGRNDFVGKTIASFKQGIDDYVGFGFLQPDNTIRFWRRFEASNPPERLARIRRAVLTISCSPKAASQLFAMLEKKCSRCGRDLTVPASLHAGLGPECAKVGRWKKADQQVAFEAQKQQALFAEGQRA